MPQQYHIRAGFITLSLEGSSMGFSPWQSPLILILTAKKMVELQLKNNIYRLNDKKPDWKTSCESLFKTVATMDLRTPGLGNQLTPVNRYTTGGFP